MQTAPTLLADITVLVKKDLLEMVTRAQVNLLNTKARTENWSSLANLNFYTLCVKYYFSFRYR